MIDTIFAKYIYNYQYMQDNIISFLLKLAKVYLVSVIKLIFWNLLERSDLARAFSEQPHQGPEGVQVFGLEHNHLS